jgi:hypothetical protein
MKEKLRALTLDQFQKAQTTKTGTFKVKYGRPERELELEEAMIFGKIISSLQVKPSFYLKVFSHSGKATYHRQRWFQMQDNQPHSATR